MANLTYPSLFQHQIVTMPAAPSNDLVTTICDNVLSFTATQRDAIMNNGWDHLADLQGFNYNRIQTSARESNRFGSVATEKLQGLAYW